MPTIRFNHVFYALLSLAALCAFAIPARISDPVRDNLKVLFYPVSWPIHAVAGSMHERVRGQRVADGRPDETLRLENDALKVALANLQGQLEVLVQDEAERKTLGDVRRLCQPSRVIGTTADAGRRQSLHVAATSGKGAEEGTPVLYASSAGGGIAGIIRRPGIAGSIVQLVSDPGFRVGVAFARLITGKDGNPDFVMMETDEALAEGDGDRGMVIRNLTWQAKEKAGITSGDWVVLRDADWPRELQRYRIGRIDSVERRAKGPGHAEIRVSPPINPINLREVMVMYGKRVNMPQP